MAKRKLSKSDLFTKTYKNTLSKNTLKKYIEILNQIDNKQLEIKSKSRWLQTKAVLDKCKKANIKTKYNLIEWNKRQDTTTKYISDRLINEEQLKSILNNLPNTHKGNQLRLVIKIAYYSGLRLSEILNLSTTDFKVNGSIKITAIGKGNKTVIAFLPLFFKEEINNFKGFDLSISYVETTYRRVLDKLNIKSNFHFLRHSGATRLLENGINIRYLCNYFSSRVCQEIETPF